MNPLMRLGWREPTRLGYWRVGAGFQRGAAIFCWVTFLARAAGQELLAPPPSEFRQQVYTPDNQFQPLAQNNAAPPGPEFQTPLRWGPFEVHGHLLYRLLYTDGLQAQPGQRSQTAINEISPGVLLDLGPHWRVDYTPSLRFYSNSRFRDTTDQSVLVEGGTSYEDWTFWLSEHYGSWSTPLVETARQTDQETYSTTLSASRQLGTSLSLELSASESSRFAQQFTDSHEWSTMDWLNDQFWPGLGVAIGAGGGYIDVSAGSDMTYEQVQGRVNWRAGDKLSFLLSGGVEDRQFVDSRLPDLIDPIFGLSIHYQLFETTAISFSGDRRIYTTFFQGQVTESTDFAGNFRQRLLKRLYLDLSAGYRMTDYKSTSTGESVSREDDFTFFSVRLSAVLLKNGTASIFYHTSDNSSNASGFRTATTQFGLDLGYHF